MQPLLSILLFIDVEKEREFDHRWFSALRGLNPRALDDLQVLVLCQRDQDTALRELIAQQPFRASLHFTNQPRAGDGYPIWDNVAAIREVWPLVEGEYVTFSHAEYVHGPGRLRRTMNWLVDERPILALGNLRRIIRSSGDFRGYVENENDPMNLLFAALVDGECWSILRDHWGVFSQLPWMYWNPEPLPGKRAWLEDIFFARRDWFTALRWWEHGGKLPFQDIYDLMGPGLERLNRDKLKPDVYRLPREIHEAVHILHRKTWGSYTVAVREWFKRHRREYADTTMTRWDLWDRILMTDKRKQPTPGLVVSDFRRAPGGTVTRWCVDFSAYLQDGGARAVRDYMDKHAGAAMA